MHLGKIKWFDETKQFGMILHVEGGGEIMIFPDEAAGRSFEEDERVTFDLTMTESGHYKAVNVKSDKCPLCDGTGVLKVGGEPSKNYTCLCQ